MSPACAASPEPPAGWSPIAGPDRAALLGRWEAHYGVAPEVFEELAFWERAVSGSIWAVRREHPLPRVPAPETVGLRVRRGRRDDTQLANGFLRRYFAAATRHVARLDDEAAVGAWWEATPVRLDEAAPPPWRGLGDDGYWVVTSPWGVLGRARLHLGVFAGEPSRGERGPVVL